MKPGIKIIQETKGTGAEAVKGKTVVISVHFFLPNGDEVLSDWFTGHKIKVDLARRDHIPGLQYGIEGMRVGGHRVFIISAHLAYSQEGVPGKIPPNSSLRCEVELLEIRDNPSLTPEDYPPGQQLGIYYPGETSRGLAKWQFWLNDDGKCSAMITVPIPGLKWHHARPKYFSGNLVKNRIASLFQWILEFPNKYPGECPDSESVYTEGGDSSWYMNDAQKTVCLRAVVYERGQVIKDYFVPETSQTWKESELQSLITDFFELKKK